MEGRRGRSREFEKGEANLSLEQPAMPPAAGGVVLTPAPTAMSEPTAMVGEIPSTPPEALQAPLSEEEIAYRKQLQEHLSKFSDKREDAK